jgi:hypothetical protein
MFARPSWSAWTVASRNLSFLQVNCFPSRMQRQPPALRTTVWYAPRFGIKVKYAFYFRFLRKFLKGLSTICLTSLSLSGEPFAGRAIFCGGYSARSPLWTCNRPHKGRLSSHGIPHDGRETRGRSRTDAAHITASRVQGKWMDTIEALMSGGHDAEAFVPGSRMIKKVEVRVGRIFDNALEANT